MGGGEPGGGGGLRSSVAVARHTGCGEAELHRVCAQGLPARRQRVDITATWGLRGALPHIAARSTLAHVTEGQ